MDMFNVFLPIAHQEFSILLLIAIGLCVGVLGGFFGVGGAWIVTPALNIFGFPMPYAIGTDLAHIFGKSIVSTKKHHKMGNVDWKLGIISNIGTVAGVETGAQLVMALERVGVVDVTVRWTYIVLLLGLGIFMLYDYYVLRVRKESASLNPSSANPHKKTLVQRIRNIHIRPMLSFPKSKIESISFWVIVFVFFFTGFLSGFLGVGGGFIRMPTLIYLLGCPTAVAVGTDLMIVLLDGAYGCFTYAMKGRVEIFAALYMLIGAAIGAQIGVTAVKYVRGYGIRLLFVIMVIFAGTSVVLKQLQSSFDIPILKTISGIVILGSALCMSAIIFIKLINAARKEKLAMMPSKTYY
jgi:uncharacterized membrane protein YfcA